MPLSPEEKNILRDVDRNLAGQPPLNYRKSAVWQKRRKARLKTERREKMAVGAFLVLLLLWIGLWVGLLAGAVVLIWRLVIG